MKYGFIMGQHYFHKTLFFIFLKMVYLCILKVAATKRRKISERERERKRGKELVIGL